MEIIRQKRKLSKTGKLIKKQLAEKGITAREVCSAVGIRENNFCDIIHTDERQWQRKRRLIMEYLGISAKRVMDNVG